MWNCNDAEKLQDKKLSMELKLLGINIRTNTFAH